MTMRSTTIKRLILIQRARATSIAYRAELQAASRMYEMRLRLYEVLMHKKGWTASDAHATAFAHGTY